MGSMDGWGGVGGQVRREWMWEETGKNRELQCLREQTFLHMLAYKVSSSCLVPHYLKAS